MARILVTGAGSAQSNGCINCLLEDRNDEIIGAGSDRHDLMFCRAHRRYLAPHSTTAGYKEALLKLLVAERPDMIHFQHDVELAVALTFRDEIEAAGVKMMVPDYETIDVCVHKYKSWLKFKAAGLPVPENMVLNGPEDLRQALQELGQAGDGRIWLRSSHIGNGGKGSLATADFDEAQDWIERQGGWGSFLAAELLTPNSITWLAIWHEGELVVAQTRRRLAWAYGRISPSGISGLTKLSETVSSRRVDEVAEKACLAVCERPHGIYGVDMTYDFNGVPNHTEINISRFFTTIEFFARAGLNMPIIFKNLCLYGERPNLKSKINPLPDHLLWVRAMDEKPILTTEAEIERTLPRL
jgi:carbamoyl-phosphate synthase large subunit